MYNFNIINVPSLEYADDSTLNNSYQNNFVIKMKRSYSYNNIPSAMGDEQIMGVWNKIKEEEFLNKIMPLSSSEDEENDDQRGDKINDSSNDSNEENNQTRPPASRFFIISSEDEEESDNENREQNEEESDDENREDNQTRPPVSSLFKVSSGDEEYEYEEDAGAWYVKSDDEDEPIHPEIWLHSHYYNGDDDKTGIKDQDELTYPKYAKECSGVIEENLTPKEIYEKYLKNQLDYIQLLKNVMEKIDHENILCKRLVINHIIGFPCCEYVFKNISFNNSLYESLSPYGYRMITQEYHPTFTYKKIVYREILFRIIQCYHNEKMTTSDLINYVVDSIKDDHHFIIYCVEFMLVKTIRNKDMNKSSSADFSAVVYIVLLKAFKQMGYNGLCRYLLSITKDHKPNIKFTDFNLQLCLELLHYSKDAEPFYSIVEPDVKDWDAHIMSGLYKEICDMYDKERNHHFIQTGEYDDELYLKKKRLIHRMKSYVDKLNIMSILYDDEENKAAYKRLLIQYPELKTHNGNRAMLSESLMKFLANKKNCTQTPDADFFYRNTLKNIILDNREYIL